MDELQQQFRNRVAKVIKHQRQSRSRVQVNASFSKAEYGILARVSDAKGISPARLVKDLALAKLQSGQHEHQAELDQLCGEAQQISQLLRTLYRDSNGWRQWQLSDIKPLLKRLDQFERKVASLFDDISHQNAD